MTELVAPRRELLPPVVDLARSSRLVVTADSLIAGHPASRTVTRLSAADGARIWQAQVGCEPATLAESAGSVYVACFDTGEVLALDAVTGSVRIRRTVGAGPFGLLHSGAALYVTLAHENAVLALWPADLSELKRVATGRQPRGLALKGERLYVVHFFDAGVTVLQAATLLPLGGIEIGQQAAVAESLTPHPRLDRIYVPHQRMNVTNMVPKFDDTMFPLVSALDTVALAPVRREALSLDSVDTPVGLPLAVALDAAGARLFSANAASDDITVVDLAENRGLAHVDVGHFPRDLALSPDGGRLYVLQQLSADVGVIDTKTFALLATFALAEDPRPPEIRAGQRLFSTSKLPAIARDRWISCASCHLDGGLDGQTWLGGSDGPRNTPTLRGIRGTEPFHASGDRPNVQSFQLTITALMAGTGLTGEQLDALAAFVNSLEPLRSPFRTRDGSLTPEATEGARVFARATCIACHTPPRFTDRRLRDVGTGDPYHLDPRGNGKIPERKGTAFKTPSLRELWLTAPYLHDGRAATLREVLTTFNREDRHGATSALSERELASLEAFLLSLPLTSEELSRLFGAGAREGASEKGAAGAP